MLVAKMFDYGRSIYARLSERRDSERRDFRGTVMVSCRNRYGSSYVCSCLNLSDSGIGLESFEPIPLKSDVYLQSEKYNLKRFGRVRWCVLRGDRYFIGCSFRRAPSFWDRGVRVISMPGAIHRPASSGGIAGLGLILKRSFWPPLRSVR
jgi:hypothetical protein